MRTVAGGGGGALSLCAPSFTISSPAAPAPASAVLRGSTFSNKANSSRICNPSLCRTELLLSLRRRRRGRRLFQAARTSKEDEADKNRDAEPNQGGEKDSVDWDKAWSSFSKPQKKKSFLKLDMEQYVSRRPKHSNYPLSEEVDPLRKSERSALGAWTSIKFTYAFLVVVIGLIVYMLIIVGPPRH